jgi:hypothetical protein
MQTEPQPWTALPVSIARFGDAVASHSALPALIFESLGVPNGVTNGARAC